MTEISREYATALFTLALECNREKEIYASLKNVKEILESNSEYVEFLSSPSIPKKERSSSLLEVIEGEEEYVCSFTALLCEHGFIKEFSSCVREYEEMFLALEKITVATVTSAVELTDAEKASLKEKLEQRTGNTVRLVTKTDKSLIAGIKIEYDGAVIDGTLKRRLYEVKEVIDK